MPSAPLSGRQMLVIGGCMVAAVVLLTIPVLGDRLTATLSKKGAKAAPRVFLLGLGIEIVGYAARSRVLDIAGGCLMGIVVLAAILDKY